MFVFNSVLRGDADLEGIKVSLSQFMQAHTILRSIVKEYANQPVLVLGGRPGAVPSVAEECVV